MRVVLTLVAVVSSLVGGLGLGPFPADEPAILPGGPVVVLETAGLTWDDISSDTPAMTALLESGSVAVSVPRSVERIACPVDGALALSAGRTADAARNPGETCRGPEVMMTGPGRPGRVLDWADYRDRAAGQGFDARLGTLGQTLAEAGRTSSALGPLATVALAGLDGTAPQAWPGLSDLGAALRTDPDVLVADLPQVAAASGEAREQQVAVVDAALVEVLNALPNDATVLVVSLADTPGIARLQLAAMVGPVRPDGAAVVGPSLLRSPSTRHDALVQTSDVLPTVLDRLGVPVPDRVNGSPLVAVHAGQDAGSRLERLLDLQQATTELTRGWLPYYVVTLGGGAVLLAGLGGGLFVTRRRVAQGGGHDRVRAVRLSRTLSRSLQWVALVAAALPAAGVLVMLVPWWRSAAPGAALVATAVTGALLLTALSLAGPWRRHPLGPPAVLGLATSAALTADAAAGSPLSLIGLLGGDPLVGGRFYGFHNPMFALFGSAVVVLGLGIAKWLDRTAGRPAWVVPATLLGLGLVAAVINVLPGLGADVGGPPALLPAMAVLALRAAGFRLTWSRVALIGLATGALLGAAIVADWLRPPSARTHLGRFMQTLVDGGAWDVVRRKVFQNLEILTSSPAMMAMPLLAALVIWALARPASFRLSWVRLAYRRHRMLPDALLALAVLSVLGFAANDSGTSIPPVVALFSLPVLLAVCAATVADEPTPPRR